MQEVGTELKTVLLVEDYEDSHYMLGRLLEMSGYRVLEASDGREAVEIAERECTEGAGARHVAAPPGSTTAGQHCV